MPLSYRIDKTFNLVVTTGTEVVTFEEFMDYRRAMLADPNFVPGMKRLVDLRSVQRVDVSCDKVRTMVSTDRSLENLLGKARVAFVASKDEIFGLARMYQLQSGDSGDVSVFHEIEDACQWLGLVHSSLADKADWSTLGHWQLA